MSNKLQWLIAIGKAILAIIGAAGAVACILVWLEVKPKDVRMMTWPHGLWIVAALVLFAISLSSSLRSLYFNTIANKQLSNKIDGLNQAHAEQIARINKGSEADLYRSHQIRDEITAELRAANEKYLAENIEKTNSQKELARAESRVKELQSELSTLRPRVVGVRYGVQASDNRAGLFLANEGEPAYDVTVPDVQFGTSKLVFHNRTVARLIKADGNVLCETWIEQKPHSGTLGNGLFHEMVSQHVDAIEMPIRYKDGHNRYYVTRCRIERDVGVNGGIAVRYLEQKLEEQKLESAVQPKPENIQSRISALCMELRGFLREYGPEPKVQRRSEDKDHDVINEFYKTVVPWKQKLQADFRLRFANKVERIRDEIQVKTGSANTGLDNAIVTATSRPNDQVKAVREIMEILWMLGLELD